MQDSSKGGHNKHVLVSGHAEPVRRFLRDLVVDSPACTVVPFAVHDVVDELVRTGTATFAILHMLSTSAPVLMGYIKHELGGGWVLPQRARSLLGEALLVAKAAYVAAVRKRKREDPTSDMGEFACVKHACTVVCVASMALPHCATHVAAEGTGHACTHANI